MRAIYKFKYEEKQTWHCRLVAMTYWAIMGGKFTNTSWAKIFVGSSQVKVKDPGEIGAVRQGEEPIKNLWKVCDNGLHVATVVYSEAESFVNMHIIATLTEPTSEWHGEQNTLLRSTEHALRWMQSMCGDGLCPHMIQT